MHRIVLTLSLLLTGLFPQAQATPQIQHWTTEDGLRVYFAQAPELPILDVQMMFDAGSARDGAQHGVASLTSSLLDKGSGDMNADAVAYRFESVGARFSASANLDLASASLRSLTEPDLLEPALDTYIRVISAPSFPEADFKRTRGITLTGLKRQEQEPDEIAAKTFYAAVYGAHPFAHPIAGTLETVAAIERAQVAQFHARHYGRRSAVLAMIGDIDRSQAEAIAKRISASLAAGETLEPIPPVAELSASQRITRPFPSGQAHVFIGQPGTFRNDPDYYTLYVGNQVLGGGGFTSRLVKEVRIQRGLAYSVYSAFSPQIVAGPFLSGLQTRADQADAAVALTSQTIKTFVEKGPTAEELKDAIDNITAGFPLRIDSNADLLGYLAVIGYYGLPLDYLDTFSAKVSAVTADNVRETFQRRLTPDRMVTVIVGQQEAASAAPTPTAPAKLPAP